MANQTTLQLKRSSVTGKVPNSANIEIGEPVVNLADKVIFTKDGSGSVIVIGAGTTSNVTEGTNLYFSNARVATAISSQTLGNATFSSDVNVRGELFVTGAGGGEGGQITLAGPVTDTALSGQIVLDVYQNRVRIFEKTGSNRGVYIDLTAAGSSVGTNLIGGGSGTITSVAGITSGAVSNAQLAAATVTSQTLSNATFSANVTADRFISLNNNNGENYRVGDDAWIGDTNVADTVRIKGLFDTAQGYILFGNNDGNKLGRNGSGALTYTAGFAAANVVSTGNISAGNAVVTNALTAGTLQTAGNINANNLRVVTNSSVGTVVSGTWNGSPISTTYTDAKVTSVNGQTGAATGFATTANSLSQFASTTSAQLATLISDETGSGALVFGTSPAITTSLTTPSSSFDLVNTTATTVNFARAATTLSVGSTSGTTTVNNDLIVTGNVTVNGTTTTINAVTVTVDDKNIELGSVASPTDVTADGGGITLKGATDKTFNYVNATTAWTSSEDLNLLTGKSYEINGTSVLNATTLGSGVVNSSLTSVGTLGSLAVTNNVSAGAFLTAGSSTAGTFQTAGNVNSQNGLVSGSLTAGTIQTAGNVNANNLRVVTNSSLGTVVQGTWNGSSISTTYTDAKVISVNGQVGAATGFATTANSLSQFASTTSAQLATLISDETGSGALVFATTPTLVTPILGTATGTSVMLSANIGAAAGNVSGSFTAGTLQTSRTNSTATGTGQIFLNGTNGNRIDWNTEGVGAPTFTTRSVGTKLTLYPTLGASTVDYAIGINSGTFWNSIPGNDAGQFFRWYGGTTEVANLSGIGNFTTAGNVKATVYNDSSDRRLLIKDANGIIVWGG